MRHDMRKSGSQEIISLEEYLDRRQKIKEKESKKEQRKTEKRKTEKSPAWMWAELYV